MNSFDVERRPVGARGRPWAALVLVCAVAPLGGGCTVFSDYNDQTEDALKDFQRGDFDAALAIYREDLNATNDSLLYHMEAGATAHYGKRYDESVRIFDNAYEKIMAYVDNAKVTAGSVGQTAASFLVNEKTLTYDGKTFEHILVQGYQARNRYMAGQRDQVGNEIIRTKELQDEARLVFRQELEAAEDAKSEKSEGVDVAGVTEKINASYDYTDLADPNEVYDITWIRYLNAFLKEAVDPSGTAEETARAELFEIQKLRPGDKLIARDLARIERASPADMKARGLEPIPPRAGSVALFFESGMAPKLTELKIYIPTGTGLAAVAFPKYEPIPNPVTGAVLVVGDERCETTTLSSVRQIAHRFHKDRLPILIAKQIVRLAAKVAIQVGGTAAIANNGGEDAQLAAAGFSLLTSAYNVISEQADLRCWRTLPDSLCVARVYLPEGEYPAKVLLMGQGGGTMATVDLGMISVKAERHRMIDARSIGSYLFAASSKEEYDGKVAGAAAPEGPTTQDLRRPDATSDKPRDERRESTTTVDQRRPDASKPKDERKESTTSTDARKPDATAAKPKDERKESSVTTAPPLATDTPKDPLAPDGPPAPRATPRVAAAFDMDRLKEKLKPQAPLCLQLVFGNEQPDLTMNATVEECHDETDARGRRLVVMTNNYKHDGVDHYFSFVIRDGEIESVDLMAAGETEDGPEWLQVSRDTFWFKPIPGGKAELDQDGDAVLSRKGVVNRERGSKSRHAATLYLRTYHAEGAPDLGY